MDRSLVFIKPDGVRRKLIGKIVNRFEDNNIEIQSMKMFTMSKNMAETHYQEHKNKDFFNNLINFVTSGPIVAMVVQADNVVSRVRELVGATNPSEANPGTIRGDFKENPIKSVTENMVHASDSNESAKREISLFFGEQFLK